MVDPKDFIAWLTTQPNARGTLYLERVAVACANYLRRHPLRLDLPLTPEERNVYACETVVEFERLRKILLSAPNYKSVNEIGHQTFSAGMKCYGKYLASLVDKGGKKEDVQRIALKMWEVFLACTVTVR